MFLVVKQGATNLSDPTQAAFFTDGAFRGAGVSTSGGISGITTPGGSDTNIQFNDGGTFGGSNNLTWDGSDLGVTGTINGTTITQEANSDLFIGDSTPTLSGGLNTAIGVNALDSVNSANVTNNVAIGFNAGTSLTGAVNNSNSNVMIGRNAASQMISGATACCYRSERYERSN